MKVAGRLPASVVTTARAREMLASACAGASPRAGLRRWSASDEALRRGMHRRSRSACLLACSPSVEACAGQLRVPPQRPAHAACQAAWRSCCGGCLQSLCVPRWASSNQSFERTTFSWLHRAVLYAASRSQLKVAAQLQRWAPAVERQLFGRGSACGASVEGLPWLPAQRFVQRLASARGASPALACNGPRATVGRCCSVGALQSPKVSPAKLIGH
jgi:hypothetical protein